MLEGIQTRQASQPAEAEAEFYALVLSDSRFEEN